jgi:hypothetical protein
MLAAREGVKVAHPKTVKVDLLWAVNVLRYLPLVRYRFKVQNTPQNKEKKNSKSKTLTSLLSMTSSLFI